MVHIDPDFKTKKAFKEAIAQGKTVYTYSPGMFPAKINGIDCVEAPADFHKWYASVEVKDSKVIRVIS